jgi:type VI secretion system protein ImpM
MSTQAPGFFGKVRSHGDFVSRRLPPQLASRWDGWLQSCIVASRDELGATWLPAYLTSPVWRFAFSGGGADGAGWAGVLMPSVDRVGRHFPLMIGAAFAAEVSLLDIVEHGRRWHDAVETLARSALEDDFQLACFDAPLALEFDVPLLVKPDASMPTPVGLPPGQWHFPIAGIDGLTSALISDNFVDKFVGQFGAKPDAASGSAILRGLSAGSSLWWTDGSPAVAPSVLACTGLPPPSLFVALLDGRWREHGWQIGGPVP